MPTFVNWEGIQRSNISNAKIKLDYLFNVKDQALAKQWYTIILKANLDTVTDGQKHKLCQFGH